IILPFPQELGPSISEHREMPVLMTGLGHGHRLGGGLNPRRNRAHVGMGHPKAHFLRQCRVECSNPHS
ncbi:MAG: hypothetical protein ACKO55_02430, partial [Bacteroidota bacterium]